MNEDWELAYDEKVEALSTCQDKLATNQRKKSKLEDLKLDFNEKLSLKNAKINELESRLAQECLNKDQEMIRIKLEFR